MSEQDPISSFVEEWLRALCQHGLQYVDQSGEFGAIQKRQREFNLPLGPLIQVIEKVGWSSITDFDRQTVIQMAQAYGNPLVRAIHEEDLPKLLAHCISIALEPRLAQKTWLQIGFGGANLIASASSRIPAYSMAPLHVMQMLAEARIPAPRLRIFTGQMAAVMARQETEDQVWPATLRNFGMLYLFIALTQPEMLKQVVWDFDRPISEPLKTIVGSIASTLKSTWYKNVMETFTRIEVMAIRHGAEDPEWAARRYAAIHPILFGDLLGTHATPWVEATAPEVLISFGGKPETAFNILRQHIMDNLPPRVAKETTPCPTVIRFITVVGEVPTYYYNEKGNDLKVWDLPLLIATGQLFPSIESMSPAIKRDMLVLFKNVDQAIILEWATTIEEAILFCHDANGPGIQGEELLWAALLGSTVTRKAIGFEGTVDPAEVIDAIDEVLLLLSDQSETIGNTVLPLARQELMGL